MADIELVLKLSEEDYIEICKCAYPNAVLVGELVYQVRNNKPLPKGHGILIEQQAVIDCLENTAKYYDMPKSDEWTKGIHYGLLHGVDNILDIVPTVIEADKENKDG